jgi:hypothetical protein
MAIDKHPCGHATCECLIERTDAFCSSYCAEAASAPAGTVDPTCVCGHRACSGESARTARLYDSIANPSDDTSGRTAVHSRQVDGGKGNPAN